VAFLRSCRRRKIRGKSAHKKDPGPSSNTNPFRLEKGGGKQSGRGSEMGPTRVVLAKGGKKKDDD